MKKTRSTKSYSFADSLTDADDKWIQSMMIPTSLQSTTAIQMQTMRDKYMTMLNSAMMGSLGGVVEEKPPSVDAAKLEALKAAEPYKVQRRMPDYVHTLTAWRAWAIVNEGGWRLKALGMNGVWEPKKVMEAECQKSSSHLSLSSAFAPKTSNGKHPAPSFNCSCGIWSFKELNDLVAAIGNTYEIKVLGQVSLWGRVIETENGFRAEKAYPKELWLMSEDLEELGLIYDVPVRLVR